MERQGATQTDRGPRRDSQRERERPHADEERVDEEGGRDRGFRGDSDEEGRIHHYRGAYSRSARRFAGGRGVLLSESFAVTGPHTGKGPKGYRRSDEQIVEEVSQRLEQHGEVDATEIEVRCEDRVVTLAGEVSDRAMKRDAEACADDAYGVDDVMNQLRIRKRDHPKGGNTGNKRKKETKSKDGKKGKRHD